MSYQHILKTSFPQHLLKLGLPALGLVRKSQGMRAFPSVQSKRAIPVTDACHSNDRSPDPSSGHRACPIIKPLPHVHTPPARRLSLKQAGEGISPLPFSGRLRAGENLLGRDQEVNTPGWIHRLLAGVGFDRLS